MSEPIRTIAFAVNAGGLTPRQPQFAGVQGDHNAARVTFTLADEMIRPGCRYRAVFTDAAGGQSAADLPPLQGAVLSCPVPKSWTRTAGVGVVRLCAVELDAAGEETQIAYSLAGRLHIAPRERKVPLPAADPKGLTARLTEAASAASAAEAIAPGAETAARGAVRAAADVARADGRYRRAMQGAKPLCGCPLTLTDADDAAFSSVILLGATTETGEGDKGPDNPYTLTGVTPALLTAAGEGEAVSTALPALEPLYGDSAVYDEFDAARGTEIRRWRRKVFDGTENWGVSPTTKGDSRYYTVLPGSIFYRDVSQVCCSHWQSVKPGLTYNSVNGVTLTPGAEQLLWLYDSRFSAGDLPAFKAYLAARAAAGAPVTVLYQLAAPAVTRHPRQGIPTFRGRTTLTADVPVYGLVRYPLSAPALWADKADKRETADTFAGALIGTASGPVAALEEVSPQGVLRRAAVLGATAETGAGEKSPGNPHTLAGAAPTALTLSDGAGAARLVPLPALDPLYGDGTVSDEYDAAAGVETRRWKRMVLDGTEDWSQGGNQSGVTEFVWFNCVKDLKATNALVCTHYGVTTSPERINALAGPGHIYIKDATQTTLDGFKAYLAAQAAAGTPVTVLYQLAAPAVVRHPPVRIPPFAPACRVAADAGQVAVGYHRDVNLVVRRLREAVARLG